MKKRQTSLRLFEGRSDANDHKSELVGVERARIRLDHVDGVGIVVAKVDEVIDNRVLRLAITIDHRHRDVHQLRVSFQRRFIGRGEEVIGAIVEVDPKLDVLRFGSDVFDTGITAARDIARSIGGSTAVFAARMALLAEM